MLQESTLIQPSQFAMSMTPVPMEIVESDSDSRTSSPLKIYSKEKKNKDVDTLKNNLLPSEIVNDALRESCELLSREKNQLGSNVLAGLSFFGEMSSIFNDSNVSFNKN